MKQFTLRTPEDTMKTWLLAVVATVGLLSGCGGPMEGEQPGTEDVTQAPEATDGQVTAAQCPDPAYCACTRACATSCGGTSNTCFQLCASEC